MTTIAEMPAGFADKVLSAQSAFRTVMDVMARPGTVQRIAVAIDGPSPLMPASAAIALTLFDHDTPVWLDEAMAAAPNVSRWIKFHTSAPIVNDSRISSFALIADPSSLTTFDHFAIGTDEYPDRSTTLLLQIGSLDDGPEIELRGPGIDGTTKLRASIDLSDRLAANRQMFPRGVDLILIAGDCIAAIPRTAQLISERD